jgi:hypothetical protein
MICRAGVKYVGTDETGASFRNWSGDVAFHPTTLRNPDHIAPPPAPPLDADGLSSLVEVVAAATELGQSVHAIGSGWAFEDCAKSDGVMVRLRNLNQQLHNVVDGGQALTDEWGGRQSYGPTRLVHFEAGVRIADLCEQLDAQGLAMPTLGGSNGQNLAGAISTSTHGGDWQQPPFPDVVRAVHLVTDGGQEWWIESATNPITRSDNNNAALLSALPCQGVMVVRDDRIFDAVRVACGRFGVIYSFVLEVRRQFRLVQVVTKPSAASVLQALRSGLGTPSVFTPLFRLLNNDPVPAGMEDAMGVPYFLQILFNSQRPADVWVTRRWETTAVDKMDSEFKPMGYFQDLAVKIIATANAALLGGGVAAGVGTAVAGVLLGPFGVLLATGIGTTVAAPIVDLVAELDALLLSGNAPFGAIVAAALNALWKVPGAAFLIPELNRMVLENNVGKAIRGSHYLVTTGRREDSDQTDFRSDSIELVFDAMTADYLDFLDEIMPVAPLFPQAGYISLRPSLRSNALLSMHHVTGKRAISIEIASIKNLLGNAAWMAFVHQAAIRYNGCPHWGQYNKLDAVTVAMLYGDSLNAWREALFSVSNTSTVFSNEFTRQRGLEPLGIVREVTSVRKRSGTITHLCNDGQSWSPVAVSPAIQEIQARTVKYIARRGDSAALIKVVNDGRGGFYLRTQADQTSADNLDNLPLSMLS